MPPRVDEDGGKVHTFVTTPRMSTYLVALIAGPYARWDDVYSDEHGDIPLGIFCRGSLAEFMDAERLFTETKQGFGFYHQNFGVPYAFGKYDQLFVPEFNAGAMENAGAVTFLEDYVFRSKVTRYSYERRAETVLHEMAHMWFGDLVTMQWWDDLWLNESFATFASVLCQSEATEYTAAWTTFANVEKSWAYRQDQLPSTHPVAADIPDLHAVEVNFDGITYAKGASVLKQLVAYVGLDAFLAGLRDYFRDHAYANATFGDLLGALEKSSGRDLSHWGRQWLKTTGLNTLRADFDVDGDGKFTRFAIDQSGAAPGEGETRVHRLAVGIYDDDGSGKLVRIHREELDVEGASTDVPALQGVPRGQLILVNDDDLTYCSLRLDPESLQTVLTRIADIAESLPRTLAWSAAWEMTREAEMKARDFVELVKAGVHAETEVGVAQRLLLQAQTALNAYADPDWACSQGWPAFADRLLELARAAEAGSDFQLAYVNALCSSALSLRHTAVLASLLDSDPADSGLTGLTVDTDLQMAHRDGAGGRWRHRRGRHRHAVHRRRGSNATAPPRDDAMRRRPRRRDRRQQSRMRRGSRSSKTTRWPTSPPGQSSPVSCSRDRPRCCSRSVPSTSTPSSASGNDDPARSPRPSSSGSTRHRTSARTAWMRLTASWPVRCRPHCVGSSSRDAQASSAHCGHAGSTRANPPPASVSVGRHAAGIGRRTLAPCCRADQQPTGARRPEA